MMPVQLVFVYIWITNLIHTDSFFSLYIFCGIFGVAAIFRNENQGRYMPKKTTRILAIVSAGFSASVIFANYSLFQPCRVLLNLLNIFLTFIGGFIISWNLLVYALNRLPIRVAGQDQQKPVRFFLLCFGSISVINLLYLFFCKYPGVAPQDTVSQMYQLAGLQPYSNWTPYWHTVTIEFFYDIGNYLFGDVNAAVACYSVVQALFASACFAYVLLTLYQMRMPQFLLCIVYVIYALLPYNIVFSITIGKDILFGLGMLFMITAFWRIYQSLGKSKVMNYLCFLFGGIGFSVWRTNGWYVFALFFLIVALFLWKSHKKLLCAMGMILLISWTMLNPFLQNKQIPNGSITETMAVPFQQFARVIVNERELTEEEESMLKEIFCMEEVKSLYTPMRADPIKFYAFRSSRTDFFKSNLLNYALLWLKLGIKYPADYLEAWIDETKGFWHGGYDMGVYDHVFPANDLGIVNREEEGFIAQLFLQYFRLFDRPDYLQLFKSIGFAVWIVSGCFLINILKKRKEAWIAVPSLIIVLSLCIGTPVYAEFRYAYPLFIVSPFVLATTLFHTEAE